MNLLLRPILTAAWSANGGSRYPRGPLILKRQQVIPVAATPTADPDEELIPILVALEARRRRIKEVHS